MSNGNNVPDDLQNSDYWDDNEVLCPICDGEMEQITASEDYECGDCCYILFKEEPDFG